MNLLFEHTQAVGISAFIAAAAWATLRFVSDRRELRKVGALGFSVAFAVFIATGAVIRFQGEADDPPPAAPTIGDVVRPHLQGVLPTSTDTETWKSAFAEWGLQWPEGDVLQTERPSEMLAFDDDFDGYLAGRSDRDGTRLVAAIGFDGDAVAWFTCYAFGTRTTATDDFLRTCWDAAAVTGADSQEGSEWVEAALAVESEEPGRLIFDTRPVCPALIRVNAIYTFSNQINMQLTIAAGQDC